MENTVFDTPGDRETSGVLRRWCEAWPSTLWSYLLLGLLLPWLPLTPPHITAVQEGNISVQLAGCPGHTAWRTMIISIGLVFP